MKWIICINNMITCSIIKTIFNEIFGWSVFVHIHIFRSIRIIFFIVFRLSDGHLRDYYYLRLSLVSILALAQGKKCFIYVCIWNSCGNCVVRFIFAIFESWECALVVHTAVAVLNIFRPNPMFKKKNETRRNHQQQQYQTPQSISMSNYFDIITGNDTLRQWHQFYTNRSFAHFASVCCWRCRYWAIPLRMHALFLHWKLYMNLCRWTAPTFDSDECQICQSS